MAAAWVPAGNFLQPGVPLGEQGHPLATGGGARQKALQIEDKALVDAALGGAPVDGAVGNEHAVPRGQLEGLPLHREAQHPLEHQNQLVLHVPVEGHLIPGVGGVYIIQLYGEVEGAPGGVLVGGQVAHGKSLQKK